MKNIISLIGASIGGLIVLVFFLYALLGFAMWVLTDPFDWIPDRERVEYIKNPDVVKCREQGGFPIMGWNGLKECREF